MHEMSIHGVTLFGWREGTRSYLSAAIDTEDQARLIAMALESLGWTARVTDTAQGFWNVDAEHTADYGPCAWHDCGAPAVTIVGDWALCPKHNAMLDRQLQAEQP